MLPLDGRAPRAAPPPTPWSTEIAQASGGRDAALALARLKERAESGDAAAQNDLGVNYEKALGVPQDLAKAVRLYKLAADQGYARAAANLGLLHYFGEGVTRDYGEAVRLFRQGATKDDDVAEFMLGTCHANGQGVAQDDRQAARLFKLAADRGNASARNALGQMYEQGRGVPRNHVEALQLYRSAAGQGDATADENLQRLGKADPRALSQASAQVVAATLEVPLRRMGGVLVLPARINDAVAVNFILDSGAADVSLPEEVVQALVGAGTLGSFEFIGSETYRLADGSEVVSRTIRLRSIKVGNRVMEKVKASIARGNAPPLLGQSFLSRFKGWSIDNGRQMLVLQEQRQ
jgi:clan AA aspartic protease (TIGR02281 family)